MDTYVFAGGGSGGHLFPAIAVARELQRRQPASRIVFVVGSRPVEQDILSREPFERRQLDAIASSELIRNPLRFGWRNWTAVRTAAKSLRELRPRVVIGCGGYISVPVAVAASRCRIPVVLLEQNVVPGRATYWLARRANAVCTSFEETAAQLPGGCRAIVTGNPVRSEIATLTETPRKGSKERPTLLVLGGSQGAASVNEALLRFAERHAAALAEWQIVHQTGTRDELTVRDRYAELSLNAVVSSFLVDMATAFVSADIVVSRAGATTLAELACAGRPAVLIPFPGAVRDHQRRNAESYAQTGAAVLASDGSADELTSSLLPLLSDAARRQRMSEQMRRFARPSATHCVADVVQQAIEFTKENRGVVPDWPLGD